MASRKPKPPEEAPQEPLELTTEEAETAIDRVGQLADEIDLGDDRGKLVASVHDWALELYRRNPKPWSALTQAEQRDLSAQLEKNAKELVRHVVEAVARQGREPIRAMLESYTEKDGIKIALKALAMGPDESLQAIIGLHKAQGKAVLITPASVEDFATEHPRDQSEPDQQGLGFEAGDDDLLAAAPPEQPQMLTHGSQITHEGVAHEVRINLPQGMVEIRPVGDYLSADDGWLDYREATSVELAHERDRRQDNFDEQPVQPELEQA